VNVDALLESVAGKGLLWRARAPASAAGDRARSSLPTGYGRLDACLPGGGWPTATLVELLFIRHGIGELTLLLPALAQLCNAAEHDPPRWLVWLSPPFDPYVPALAQAGIDPERVLLVSSASPEETLWAAEQTLRSGNCGAVLAWVEQNWVEQNWVEHTPWRPVAERWLRRLKLAAEQGACLGVLFRPARLQMQSSPAALRLLLKPGRAPGALDVEVLKSRGGAPAQVRDVFRRDDSR